MAPMQWLGTGDVLEELAGTGMGSTGLSGTGPAGARADTGLGKAYGSAELPCRDDPELFFAESPDDVELAKSLCGGCAVRVACLTGAIARAEPWGVWGGQLFLRGEIVPRKRPRGRPRKDVVAA